MNNDPITTADNEAAEADRRVEDLEEQVRNGDDTITADHIEQQRGLSRFAKLRAEAARRKAARNQAKQRRRDIDAVAADIDAQGDDTARLIELRNQAESAIEAFAAACEERNQWVRHTAARLRSLDVPARNEGEPDPSGATWHTGAVGAQVTTPNARFDEIKTGAHIADAVHQVARRHGGLPAGGKDLDALTYNHTAPAQRMETNR
ncbi:hypothetical protein [Nocardiopsis kunsanensis]|uniref:hypothetical protein n=1 Tax=Nocardiopsis kunsanensis TaxID=141693 RepID=UPI000348251E|nr:hypothetical protein [Nocardiopsis kunsanensis]